jgi:D-arabinose 1-dehydrogenase-like Zn-dependent alcohol dehydrogenase
VKAAFVKKVNKFSIREIPVPRPSGREVLVGVDACGVCASDNIEARSWAVDWKRFGHEIVASVLEIGDQVTGFSPGDQVVVALSAPCGVCSSCTAGDRRRCTGLVVVEQGGFAEKLLVRDCRLLYRVEPPLANDLACLTEPLTVILDAFALVDLSPTDSLLIVGGGNIGCMAALAAKARKVKVLGTLGRAESTQLEACLEIAGGQFFEWHTIFGRVVMGLPSELRRRLAAVTGRIVVLHTAPPRLLSRYVEQLPYDTTVVNIGLAAEPRENRVGFDACKLLMSRIQLMSAFPVPCLYVAEAVALLREHAALFQVINRRMITLDELPGLLLKSDRRGAKVIVEMAPRTPARG